MTRCANYNQEWSIPVITLVKGIKCIYKSWRLHQATEKLTFSLSFYHWVGFVCGLPFSLYKVPNIFNCMFANNLPSYMAIKNNKYNQPTWSKTMSKAKVRENNECFIFSLSDIRGVKTFSWPGFLLNGTIRSDSQNKYTQHEKSSFSTVIKQWHPNSSTV